MNRVDEFIVVFKKLIFKVKQLKLENEKLRGQLETVDADYYVLQAERDKYRSLTLQLEDKIAELELHK